MRRLDIRQCRDVQVATIRRLADKMECTTDCFTSDDQADAIVRGLARTDLNMRDLVDDINNYASNGREADIERRQMVPSLVRGLVRQGGAPADPGCYEAACEATVQHCSDQRLMNQINTLTTETGRFM